MEGQAAPTVTLRLSITIKHFNDLLSDESLDFIVIHHVSLRKEKKTFILSSLVLSPPGIDIMEIKDEGKQRSQEPPTDT